MGARKSFGFTVKPSIKFQVHHRDTAAFKELCTEKWWREMLSLWIEE